MKKTAFLCLMLAAVIYFAGSFWTPLSLGQHGAFGCASARDMTGSQETDQMPGLSDEAQEDQEGSRTDKAGEPSGKGIPPADFEIIRQMPELPTGCEITALTMMLNYYGYSVDKMTMASEYLPTIPAEFYEGADGRSYGPDMEAFFCGRSFLVRLCMRDRGDPVCRGRVSGRPGQQPQSKSSDRHISGGTVYSCQRRNTGSGLGDHRDERAG